jgi:hypothetical protein
VADGVVDDAVRVGGGHVAHMADSALTPEGSFGPYEMKVLLDKHECTDCVGLETGTLERDGVPLLRLLSYLVFTRFAYASYLPYLYDRTVSTVCRTHFGLCRYLDT